MSESEFDKLLSYLHADGDQAAISFQELRRKLIFYFQKHNCPVAEDKTDETLTLVSEKLAQEKVRNIWKYSYGVARNLLKEYWRQQAKGPVSLDELSSYWEPSVDPEDEERIREEEREQGRRVKCMRKCLQALDKENRDLVILYCSAKSKDQVRERLGIELTVIRVKVHRIRVKLNKCLADCLDNREEG